MDLFSRKAEIKMYSFMVTALEKTGLRRLFDGQVVSFDIYDDRGRNAAGNIIILK